ncbi:MAG TPA: phosphoribosylformylglycinamidine synthase, purS protein [Thermoplasmatales archaeon]|nr:phosphoribosylformylglycinamidine synthase subunit PurS [Candidatus Thermoplasmatota archaeon]MDD5778121.1 phosphoribosylformylglycinamidine synthase subunit PurS [Candidatus Thermoplasmatota archaeon]HDS59250.1 phosphoribosylformylglycinamidine synthase, purS protein [Thermoplasmatales archaeon]
MFRVTVEVRLKKGISDPEGRNVVKALHLLGFDEVKEAAMVRVTELTVEGTSEAEVRRRAEEMCQRLLTNPVIHDYVIRIEGM